MGPCRCKVGFITYPNQFAYTVTMNAKEATGVNILSGLKENRWLPGTKLEETEVLDIWQNQ